MRTIYIASYPKSGSTWLTRLLADALNCPAGASRPSEDRRDAVTEGQDRPAPFVVRRGHFKLIDGEGPLVPRPHTLAWRNLTDQAVVFLVRDPRDIAVSDSFYFKRPLARSVSLMITRQRRLGTWAGYVYSWLNSKFKYTLVRYEDLLTLPGAQVTRILSINKLPMDAARIAESVERQSFAARHQLAQEQTNKHELRSLRLGIAGDWKNHFTPKLKQRLMNHAGALAKRLRYV